ncbi:MAG: DUF1524 domain-containing protein [Acidimicrobiia bacterium]
MEADGHDTQSPEGNQPGCRPGCAVAALAVLLALALVLVVVVVVTPDADDQHGDESGDTSQRSEQATGSAGGTDGDTTTIVTAAGMEQLEVAPEDGDGYDRDLFGDYERDPLLDESLDEHGCYYSAADGACHADPANVHVDHLVPLAEAWESGISPGELDAFAGDPDNLWLMTADLNTAKSDRDVAEWLPPEEQVVCRYVERWVEVKVAYDLTVDRAEHRAIAGVLATC